MDDFIEDLKLLGLINDYNLTVLIDKYENTLKETLQEHPPQKWQIITLQPQSPWYNQEVIKKRKIKEN